MRSQSHLDHPRRLGVARLLITVVIAGLSGCDITNPSGGSPCGRNQHASAHVILPDTGINAGRKLLVGFLQRDPDILGELSEVSIQQDWLAGRGADPEADPRVRLVTDAGRVLLDTIGTRLDQPTGQNSRPTWMVFRWIKSAADRTALFEAFRDEALWLELWHHNASSPGTRVRAHTDEVGVYPPAVCL